MQQSLPVAGAPGSVYSMKDIFEPSSLEGALYAEWESNDYFAPAGNGRPFCIAIPPPNITGRLHLGHAFQHTPHGRIDPIPAHERPPGAMADGDRPRQHRHPDDRRAPARGRGHQPRHGRTGSLPGTRLGVARSVRRRDFPAIAAHGVVARLVAGPVHHGRGFLHCRQRSLRAAVRRRADLQAETPGELGPGPQDGGVRPGSGQRGGERSPVAHPLSAAGWRPDIGGSGPRRRRDHPARKPCSATRGSPCTRTIPATAN